MTKNMTKNIPHRTFHRQNILHTQISAQIYAHDRLAAGFGIVCHLVMKDNNWTLTIF